MFCRCQDFSEGTKQCAADGLAFSECGPCLPDVDTGAPDTLSPPDDTGADADADADADEVATDGAPIDAAPAARVRRDHRRGRHRDALVQRAHRQDVLRLRRRQGRRRGLVPADVPPRAGAVLRRRQGRPRRGVRRRQQDRGRRLRQRLRPRGRPAEPRRVPRPRDARVARSSGQHRGLDGDVREHLRLDRLHRHRARSRVRRDLARDRHDDGEDHGDGDGDHEPADLRARRRVRGRHRARLREQDQDAARHAHEAGHERVDVLRVRRRLRRLEGRVHARSQRAVPLAQRSARGAGATSLVAFRRARRRAPDTTIRLANKDDRERRRVRVRGCVGVDVADVAVPP